MAWKDHGSYRVKPADPLLEIFEPYNANIATPMERLAGEMVAAERVVPASGPHGADGQRERAQKAQQLRIIRSWEQVARDGREFAENGGGMRT